MHLAHPALTTTGRRRGRQRFRNADQARLTRELSQDWEALKQKWASPPVPKATKITSTNQSLSPKLPPGRSTTAHIPSIDSGGSHNTAKITKVYTGTKVVGIATLHKSNAVPVFSQQEAVDISKMRRG